MFAKLLSNEKDVLGSREALDKLEDSVYTLDDNENIQERNRIFGPDKSNLNAIPSLPENANSILDVLDNKDYFTWHEKLAKEIINHFYLSVEVCGNCWPIIFCIGWNKVDHENASRKATLEFLNMENNKLLSVQISEPNIPVHITSYEKKKK